MSATKPEIDWNDDEAVCKTLQPLLYQSVSASLNFWKCARKRKSISDYEEKFRAPAAVDVKRELYNALRAILPFLNKLNQFDYGKTARIAHDAINLYEQKGKL